MFGIKLIWLRSELNVASSVWVVFNNFIIIDTTDRSKISSDQNCFFIASSLYPLSFLANTLLLYFLLPEFPYFSFIIMNYCWEMINISCREYRIDIYRGSQKRWHFNDDCTFGVFRIFICSMRILVFGYLLVLCTS